MNTLLSLLILSITLSIAVSAEELTLQISGLTDTGAKFYCKNLLFDKLAKTKEERYVTKFQGAATPSANVKYIQLWDCYDVPDFAEKNTYKCDDDLPDPERCHIVYSWNPTDNRDLTLPKDVAFFAGPDKEFNKLILVTQLVADPTNQQASVVLTHGTSKPKHEAGIMNIGVKKSSLSLQSGEATVEVANNCENDCALLGDWFVFSATPLMYSLGQNIQTAYYRKGLLRRFFLRDTDFSTNPDSTHVFTADPTGALNPNERVKIGQDDRFSVECSYDTTSKTSTVTGGNSYSKSESCYTYLNYYPKASGIKSCLNGECINKSGDANFFTNVVVNYIALTLASMLVGIIIGFALHMIVVVVGDWFSANSGRFSKQNLVSFVWLNPMWWMAPYEEEEDEDEEKDRLMTSDEAIPADDV